jgi:hypothetical protein
VARLLISKFFFLALFIGISDCNTTGYGPSGLLYSDTKIGISGTGVEGSKIGESCVVNIMNLYASGDATIEKALKNSGITKISSVNYRMFNIFLYGKLCIQVLGD